MSKAEKLARFNLIFTFVWLALALPSLLFWKDSILWVIVISLWANIVGHFSAYLAAHSEAAQEKGHNLTKQDMAWILAQLEATPTTVTIRVTADTTTSPPAVITEYIPTANPTLD